MLCVLVLMMDDLNAMDIQLLLNLITEPLASLLIHHPVQPTGIPHCHSDLETHRHNDIAHPQIICIIVVLKVLEILSSCQRKSIEPLRP